MDYFIVLLRKEDDYLLVFWIWTKDRLNHCKGRAQFHQQIWQCSSKLCYQEKDQVLVVGLRLFNLSFHLKKIEAMSIFHMYIFLLAKAKHYHHFFYSIHSLTLFLSPALHFKYRLLFTFDSDVLLSQIHAMRFFKAD